MADFAYFDSSALTKLLLPERETSALEAWLLDREGLFSSRLSVAECGRALLRAGRAPSGDAVERTFESFVLLDVNAELLERTAALPPPALRTLDALHVSSALSLGERDLTFVTYDNRLADAARAHGLTVVQPGR